MAYIGNIPAESYASYERQVFTIVNSQTAYTLTHAVTNENDIRLVVNNVVQEPGSGKAYTASGTTLTLSAALVNGTDEMYCVYLGRALQTVNPPAASVGNSQTAPTIITGQTAETSIATDDLILLSDTSASGALKKMTRANFVSGIGGTNTPAFFALGDTQNVTYTRTKVTFSTEVIDTAGAFASSKFTVPSGQAGKYFIFGSIKGEVDTDNHLLNMYSNIYKNGSNSVENRLDFGTNGARSCTNLVHALLDLSVGDYVELYGLVQTSSSQASFNAESNATHFGGYKIIE